MASRDIESSFGSFSQSPNEIEISSNSDRSDNIQNLSRSEVNRAYTCKDKFESGMKWIIYPFQQCCSSKRNTHQTSKRQFDIDCLKPEFNRVNGLLKYFTFGIMFTNGLLGFVLFFIGLWSSFEQRKISHLPTTNVKQPAPSLNPFNLSGIILCILGLLFFILCILSSLGINRENLNLLRISLIGQFLTFVIFLMLSILISIWAGKIRHKVAELMLIGLKQYYHVDKAWTTFFDKLHLNYFCCGVYSFNDWNDNPNYACESSTNVQSFDACSVPYTCCKIENDTDLRTNSFGYTCGKNVLPSQNRTINMNEIQERINVNGCFDEILPIIQQLVITAGIFMFLICIIVCITIILTCLLVFEIRLTLSNVQQYCQNKKHSIIENPSDIEEQHF